MGPSQGERTMLGNPEYMLLEILANGQIVHQLSILADPAPFGQIG